MCLELKVFDSIVSIWLYFFVVVLQTYFLITCFL